MQKTFEDNRELFDRKKTFLHASTYLKYLNFKIRKIVEKSRCLDVLDIPYICHFV